MQSLQDIRSDDNFFDVTLACDDCDARDDKSLVRGHKIILSAASPYFRDVLKHSPASHHTVIVNISEHLFKK
jgi:hypothetical protein